MDIQMCWCHGFEQMFGVDLSSAGIMNDMIC